MIVVTTPAGNIGQQTLCGILDTGEMPRRPGAGLGSTGDAQPAAGLSLAMSAVRIMTRRGAMRASTLR